MNSAELLRYERGMTVAQVSAETKISEPTIYRIEKGIVKPGPATAKTLADFYKVTVGELLGIDSVKDAA
jgi:transcriptional regulator with XRE-family HTH domain